MKIELKNIKHMESLSEETNCYSASLYVDGKKIGDVSNQGHGGPDNFYGDQAAFRAADAWVTANMPPLKSDYSDEPLKMDLELYCGQLLETHLITQDLKKTLRGKVLFKRDAEPGLLVIGFKGVRKIEPVHIEKVRQKHPDAVILNDLPFEDALQIYRDNG